MPTLEKPKENDTFGVGLGAKPKKFEKPTVFLLFLHKMLTVSSEIAVFGILGPSGSGLGPWGQGRPNL